MNLQKILAATDYSRDGRHAAERAAILCSQIEASQGVLLHVLESSWLDTLKHFVSLSEEVDRSVTAKAQESLKELTAAIRKRNGVGLEPWIRTGPVLEMILEAAAEFNLLVLGARGRHPLRDFTVGTTTQRLLRRTSKPVLVVRRKAVEPYRRVLVAVDFSSYSANALAYGQAVAPGAEIYLTHVYQALFEGKMQDAGVSVDTIHEYRRKARNQSKMAMRNFIEAAKVGGKRLHLSIEYGSHVPSKLLSKIRHVDADLVVVGKHGKSLVENFLMGSVTLHMLAECPCDVLVTQCERKGECEKNTAYRLQTKIGV